MGWRQQHWGFVTVRLDFKLFKKVSYNLNVTSWHRLLVGENALLPPDASSVPCGAGAHGLASPAAGPSGLPMYLGFVGSHTSALVF